VPKSFDPSKIEGKITDTKELRKVIEAVIKKNGKAVEDYKSGDVKAINFLMGEVMKATQKRADFLIARKILLENLR
jgi:aspartyl-tRNA(Asn)/glutamyl-tRNA(Gln) amidotransferase subunit B